MTSLFMSIYPKFVEKDEFSMKFAIWAPKKRQNGENQFVRQIRKKSWKSIKNRPFCNSALNQLKIEIIHFFKVLAVSTSP
jgi:mannosyltransferase OCH1-like enzyme